jgi:hypothetical protein
MNVQLNAEDYGLVRGDDGHDTPFRDRQSMVLVYGTSPELVFGGPRYVEGAEIGGFVVPQQTGKPRDRCLASTPSVSASASVFEAPTSRRAKRRHWLRVRMRRSFPQVRRERPPPQIYFRP